MRAACAPAECTMAATRRTSKAAAPSSSSKPAKFSVLLPTYNERENIPLIVYLLVETFEKKWVKLRQGASTMPPIASGNGSLPRLPPLQRDRL